MRPLLARMLFVIALAGLVPLLGLWSQSQSQTTSAPQSTRTETTDRTIFLAGQLGEEELIAFSTNLAASGLPGTLLLDAPKYDEYTRHFLAGFKPRRDRAHRRRCPGPGKTPGHEGQAGREVGVGGAMGSDVPQGGRQWCSVRAQPRRLLLQAAVLAGALKAPLMDLPRRTRRCLAPTV